MACIGSAISVCQPAAINIYRDAVTRRSSRDGLMMLIGRARYSCTSCRARHVAELYCRATMPHPLVDDGARYTKRPILRLGRDGTWADMESRTLWDAMGRRMFPARAVLLATRLPPAAESTAKVAGVCDGARFRDLASRGSIAVEHSLWPATRTSAMPDALSPRSSRCGQSDWDDILRAKAGSMIE